MQVLNFLQVYKGSRLGDSDNGLLTSVRSPDPRLPPNAGRPSSHPWAAGWGSRSFPGAQPLPGLAGRADGTSRPAQVVAPAPAYRNSPTTRAPAGAERTEPAPRFRWPSSCRPLGALAVLTRALATGEETRVPR